MILDGKIGVITGAAQGIGRAYALEVAAQGAKVVVADIADVSVTAKLIEDAGGEALAVTVDVADEASVERMAKQVLDRFDAVDFLVNNAAIYGSLTLKYWEDLSVQEWNGLMAVNVRGPWLVSKPLPLRCRHGTRARSSTSLRQQHTWGWQVQCTTSRQRPRS